MSDNEKTPEELRARFEHDYERAIGGLSYHASPTGLPWMIESIRAYIEHLREENERLKDSLLALRRTE